MKLKKIVSFMSDALCKPQREKNNIRREEEEEEK